MTEGPRKKILILDTGREWGGGINNLIKLLESPKRGRYDLSALFYDNYTKGPDSDVKRVLESFGVDFIRVDRRRIPLLGKILKELFRALFFWSRSLKRKGVFLVDLYFRILPNSKDIESLLKEGAYDLLYMNNQPSSNLEGLLAAKGTGVTVLQHARKDAPLNPFEVGALNDVVTKVICVSDGIKRSLVSRGVDEKRCTVVYDGIDPEITLARTRDDIRGELGVSEGTVLIGTVSSLIRLKRVDILIEAVAKLKGRGLDVACVIVGSGAEEEVLKGQACFHNLGGTFIFTGFKSDPLPYIEAMDIFALPSSQEGLPGVVLEAMALSKPVVAFDVIGVRELVFDSTTGYLVPDNDRGGFAESLEELVLRSDKRVTFGKEGRREVSNFSLEGYIEGTFRVIDEVLG